MAASRRLIVVGTNELWYEDSAMAGTMTKLVASEGEIDVTRPVSIFGLYGKGFVANEANLGVVDFVNVKLEHLALTTAHIKGDIIEQDVTGGIAKMVVDFTNSGKTATYGHAYYTGTATAFKAGAIDRASGSGDLFTITEITDPPHWYDWTPYPTVGAVSYGSMPEQATLGCAYRGRAVLSGNKLYPYQWYMSRQGNPWDWAYAANDARSPVAGAEGDAGQAGDVVVALAPYQDDYMIIGCASSMWVMRGDPAAGGSMDQLSHATGIYGQNSFCWDANSNFYFWGQGGIYRIPAGLGAPDLITEARIPNIVVDEAINPLIHRITFGYDAIRNGIVISIVNSNTGANSNYWYNIVTDGFFPETYPTECAPYSLCFHTGNDPTVRGLLVGCTDGYIREYDESSKSDEVVTDTAISSKAFIGPGAIAKDADNRGRMNTLSITTGSNTDGVTYDVYVKDTAEEVVDDVAADATPLHTGTIAGPNRIQKLRPRSRGAYMGIVLTNSVVDETWSFEKTVAEIVPAGGI